METPPRDAINLTVFQACHLKFARFPCCSVRRRADLRQGLVLATAEGSALEALVSVADQLRQETVGDAITYVVQSKLNFTNICFVDAVLRLAADPALADAYSLSFGGSGSSACKLGTCATEVCVQGGLPPTSTDFSTAIFFAPSSMRFQHARACLTLADGDRLRRDVNGKLLRDYLQMMKDEGSAAFPARRRRFLMIARRELV